jgi:hypothetical protein
LESNYYYDIRQKLAEQLCVSARLYSEAVVALTRFQNLTQAEYANLHEAAERALLRAKEASLKFEEHVVLHHCGLTDYRAASV